jgi:hypothetical protein
MFFPNQFYTLAYELERFNTPGRKNKFVTNLGSERSLKVYQCLEMRRLHWL